MKTCPNCGAQNEDTAIVCTNCGNIMGADEGQSRQNAQPEYGPNMQNNAGYPYHAPSEATSDGFSVAALVMGIFSILFSWLCCGGIFSILSIVFGFIGKSRINNSGGAKKGNGMAIAGIVMGIAAIVIGIAVIAVLVTSKEFWNAFSKSYEQYSYGFGRYG